MLNYSTIVEKRYTTYVKHPLKDNVFFAHRNGEEVVIKFFDDINIMESEYEILNDLSSTGFVCAVINKESYPFGGFLELEFCEGNDLRYVKCFSVKEKRLIASRIIDFYVELEKRGIIYFDLQADHVIVHKSTVRFLDFGNTLRVNDAGVVFNTVNSCFEKTAAPEMLQKGSIISRAANVYSMACLIYYLYIGNYYSDTHKINAKVIPNSLINPLQRALARDLTQRIQDIKTFKELVKWS